MLFSDGLSYDITPGILNWNARGIAQEQYNMPNQL
jgi:hypothetical protein